MIYVELQNKGQHLNSKIYIVDKLKQPLLSGETSEKLNIVRMIQQLSSNFLNPKREFPEIFNGLGHAKINYKISLQPDAKPYALCTPRRVPIPLMKQVKEQLEEMTRLGVIESVEEPTEWCAGMVAVSKPGGKIRICVDLTKLNQYIRRENYPLPATEHILGQLANACYFSKLDANSGFWQFGLAKESQKLTTFITPFGRFFFKRIPFGITSAPEIFQRKMTQLLGKIEGVVCFMDDIVVYGSSLEEHNERVRQVLKKIQEEGMTLNPEKCQFGVKTVKFLGHTLSSEGLFIDEEKLDAITKMEAPRSTKELKYFLGMVNYLGKFIPNLADKLQPLNSLLSTKNEWVWDEPQKKSFNLLKQELVSRPNLALFDPSRTTIVSADASSFGLGGVLRQEQPDGSLKPIAYVSRTLSETEKRYSQIEKGLAIVWTCDRLKDYVTGIKIHIETDHKPLIAIFTSKSLEDMTPRLQRLKMRMMRKQKEDSLCSQLAKYCMSGWPKNKREVDPALRGYWQFQEDLTYQNGLLLRGQIILIPKSLRKDILEKLHQGHFGINKCRSRAKESVWWLGISQEIERMVSSCTKCLKERKPKHEPLMPSEFPIRPWQKVGMDLFYLNGRWNLIVCDYYSSPKFPQSNGFIEAIIKNIKQSFKKEEDCYLTLQAYRTMPLESGYSPAELLMGRRLRTSVPAIESSLIPRYLDSEALQEREKRKVINQKRLYDKRHDVHCLPPLQQGDSVWIRDQRVEGTVLHKSEEPRSYWVQTPQGKVRRNRLHLTPLPKMGGTMDASEEGQRQEQRNEETPTSTSTRLSRRCKDDQEQETEEDCPTPTASSTRDGRMQRDNQDQDPEKSLPSMPAVHTRYGRAVKIPRRRLLEVSAVEDSSNLDNDEDECRRRWTAEIQVNGKKVKFKLDSQADVTCVPLCLFKKIMGQQRLVKSDINLRAAEFSELQTVGMFISTLRNGNYEIKEIYVIRRLSEPLLSRRACELLNLARRIKVVATRINPIKEFPEVFEGLGQIGNPYEIKLKPGTKPYAVHTPRRVPIPLMEKLKTRLEELDKDDILTKIFEAQQEDTTLKAVVNYLEQGWPDKKMSQALLSYWHVKDELGVQNGLLMRSCRLVIPASMKLEILEKLHAGHFGITKTRLRARETVWWPGISEEIAETVRKCSVCIQEAVSKHEPLIPTNFPTRPWQKIGMDLFKFENKWYLVVIVSIS
ncbi:K02A2.6-like [Cordylochernes scorpioides]|uniref:RNA-directed DNA polymerase n=1 Tax=Cordylochernes scorpioides TaxID=51811 RepID=A0ABY6K041_9ARAC|nr:K02A2.6-like [Cordylochernes scorpioides]